MRAGGKIGKNLRLYMVLILFPQVAITLCDCPFVHVGDGNVIADEDEPMEHVEGTDSVAVMVAKGQECIKAAQTALNLIMTQGDTENAIKQLSLLLDDGRSLQDFAEESKKKLELKEKELKNKMTTLESQRSSYESNTSRLNFEKNQAETRLSTQHRLLTEAKNELRCAEKSLNDARSELRRAKEKEKAAMTTSVVTGVVVGLFTFGVGGAAVGGALGAGIAALINELEGKVERAESNIQNRKANVGQANNEIESISSSLRNIECEIGNYRSWISNNERQMKDVHNEITSVLDSIAFQKEVVEFWKKFTEVAERATERTELLKWIVNRAAKKENLQILRSDGTIVIAITFMDAWEEVPLCIIKKESHVS